MVTFRKAEETDIPKIQELARETWELCYKTILTPAQIEYMLEMMYSQAVIDREMGSGVIWELVELNNEAVGFVSFAKSGDETKLNKLYLKPALQGKGVGNRSLMHVVDCARSNGSEKVYLTVNKHNATAIKAYERAGFVRTDSKVFDIGNGYVMDDYIYTFKI
ncbi:MAG: GNAT family N-acetyltransferase [Bacteroidota bacterium]|nr:GNAT family N-acetyltransferase [Bacteroidota bacterium]